MSLEDKVDTKKDSFKERVYNYLDQARGFFKNFLIGAGSALNVYPQPMEYEKRKIPSDKEVLESDWKAVGDDMYKSLEEIEKEDPQAAKILKEYFKK